MVAKNSNLIITDARFQFRIFKLNVMELKKKIEIANGKWHSFIYITAGKGVLHIDFDEHTAVKGKVFFIEKYKNFKWIRFQKIEGVMVQFTDAFYNHIYTGNPKIKSDQSLIGDISPYIKIQDIHEKEWADVFNILLLEYALLKENSTEILCLTLKILILMYRRNAYAKSLLIISDRRKQLLSEFRKLVNNSYSELKTPKAFAMKLNITPNYLNALCREIYNKTVSEIIQERFILEAKRMLAHSGLSVSEIAFKLGFADNSYFGRYFKKVVGMPPEKYRSMNYN
ncbi:MAG TPA: AraC family transcriptional regulator [Bacteroidales bacterium]|nr:AraC family transcriptional regulator [Bacteroidales bacterium]